MKQKSIKKVVLWVFMAALTLLFLSPFYFVVVNSVKDYNGILSDTASLPRAFHWENFAKAWQTVNFPRAFRNTLIATLGTVLPTILIAPMCAYRMVRHPTKINRIIQAAFIASMVIPVQAIMLPLVEELSVLKIVNSMPGLILSYIGIGIAFSTFLYLGYVKSVPLEIEESAVIDGCNPYQVYFKIVFPLLKPMTITVALLKTIWCWNEYMLALLILQKKELRTLQLSINTLFSEYRQQWDLALPALLIAIIPTLIFFLFMQKRIIEGMVSGSVKG